MAIQSSKTNELRQAIQTFAASSRFQLLKKLQVGRLMPEGCGDIGSVYELTFENLVELGSERIVSGMNLSPLQEASLVELLRALSAEQEMSGEGADEEVQEESLDTLFDPPRANEAPEEETPLSSVQLELNLRHCLEALRSHANYQSIRRATIGSFWDPSWTPAPFEEALTIDQLSNMDLTVLFKKRMVNDKRITCIVMALERALESLGGAARSTDPSMPERMPERVPRRSTPTQAAAAREIPIRWESSAECREPIDAAVIDLVMVVAGDERYAVSRPILLGIMNALAPDEFVALVQEREVSRELVARARALSAVVFGDELCELIGASLRGPGVHQDVVSGALASVISEPASVRQLLGVLVLRGLGAQPVEWRRSRCPGFWTLYPQAIQSVLGAGKGRVPSGAVDPKLLQWCKDQEGRIHPGKGSHKARGRRYRTGK